MAFKRPHIGRSWFLASFLGVWGDFVSATAGLTVKRVKARNVFAKVGKTLVGLSDGWAKNG